MSASQTAHSRRKRVAPTVLALQSQIALKFVSRGEGSTNGNEMG